MDDGTAAPRGRAESDAKEQAPQEPAFATTVIRNEAGPRPAGGAELSPGMVLGRYVLLDAIGRGGMGDVYAAIDPKLDRWVALKLVRVLGSYSEEVNAGLQARLLREAQAMARLSHPNVVSVYDTGTVNGQLFLAMEYVRGGQTVADWLEGARRSWQEVRRVFLEAGRGLAAAHRAGLIHRDFKPANILMADDGRIRVADFGLARGLERASRQGTTSSPEVVPSPPAADPSLAAQSALAGAEASLRAGDGAASLPPDAPPPRPGDDVETRTVEPLRSSTSARSLAGTPAYMAPEQYLAEPPDARSDQFAFCVSLYEALYGNRPFRGALASELREAILACNVPEPPRGSRVPAWLHRIVLKGLSRAPADRFPSMDALLDALDRKPAANRLYAGASFVAVLAVLAVFLGDRVQELRRTDACRVASRRLHRVWDGPTRDLVRGSFAAVDRPYVGAASRETERVLDDYATAWAAQSFEVCRDLELSERSRAARELCLDAKRRHFTALVDLLSSQPGEGVISRAVESANSLSPLAECVSEDIARSAFAVPSEAGARARVEEVRNRLAKLQVQAKAGQVRHALAEAQAVVDSAEQTRFVPAIAEAHLAVAQLKLEASQFEAAEQSYFAALVAAESIRQESLVAAAATGLVRSLGGAPRRYDEGLRWGRFAEAVLATLPGQDVQSCLLRQNTAWVLASQGNGVEAQRTLEGALPSCARALGAESYEMGRLHQQLGLAYLHAGRYPLAAEATARARAIYSKTLGEGHPRLADLLANEGEIARGQGRFLDAERSYEEALRLYTASLGEQNERLADPLHGLARLYVVQGQFERALPLCERGYALIQRHDGKSSPNVAFFLSVRGEAELGLGRLAEAVQTLERSLALAEQHRLRDDNLLGRTRFALARALWAKARAAAPVESALVARARQLAVAARDESEGQGALDAVRDVDTWLGARPAAAR